MLFATFQIEILETIERWIGFARDEIDEWPTTQDLGIAPRTETLDGGTPSRIRSDCSIGGLLEVCGTPQHEARPGRLSCSAQQSPQVGTRQLEPMQTLLERRLSPLRMRLCDDRTSLGGGLAHHGAGPR